jgi:hypothetical protein
MDFPINDLFDENLCDQCLIKFFHNGVLKNPTGSINYINDSRRSPKIRYKDKDK